MNRPTPKIGDKYGMLTITGVAGRDKWRSTIVNTKCACGGEKTTLFKLLLRGDTRSCGCIKTLGNNRSHGKCNTPVYRCYRNMLNRCYFKKSKSYQHYGARGITVCKRWRDSFENFLEDMGEPPNGMTLERINNDLGYSKENCIWATRKQQTKNRRNAVNICHKGKTMSLSEWSEKLGLKYRTLRARIFELKWSLDKALTTKLC
jgi:hypothetical protein